MAGCEKTLKIFQKGFNYSQDGLGNRLILHLQGCNMRCPWCSNPEGMFPEGVLFTEKEWLSESCCPRGAVCGGNLDRSVCAACAGRPCLSVRQKGIRLSYNVFTLDEVVDECVRSKPMFFDGGGVTLTGGEVTMQFDAVKELLQRLGEEGIHRAIETNGCHARAEELFPLVDQWIMDVKHYDEETHRKWTGVSNALPVATLRKAAAVHPDVLVRIPLIPGFNDSPQDAVGFAQLFSSVGFGSNVRLELLSYHEFGKGKWAQCGLEYTMPSARISPETVIAFEKLFREHGINCVRT